MRHDLQSHDGKYYVNKIRNFKKVSQQYINGRAVQALIWQQI